MSWSAGGKCCSHFYIQTVFTFLRTFAKGLSIKMFYIFHGLYITRGTSFSLGWEKPSSRWDCKHSRHIPNTARPNGVGSTDRRSRCGLSQRAERVRVSQGESRDESRWRVYVIRRLNPKNPKKNGHKNMKKSSCKLPKISKNIKNSNSCNYWKNKHWESLDKVVSKSKSKIKSKK